MEKSNNRFIGDDEDAVCIISSIHKSTLKDIDKKPDLEKPKVESDKKDKSNVSD